MRSKSDAESDFIDFLCSDSWSTLRNLDEVFFKTRF